MCCSHRAVHLLATGDAVLLRPRTVPIPAVPARRDTRHASAVSGPGPDQVRHSAFPWPSAAFSVHFRAFPLSFHCLWQARTVWVAPLVRFNRLGRTKPRCCRPNYLIMCILASTFGKLFYVFMMIWDYPVRRKAPHSAHIQRSPTPSTAQASSARNTLLRRSAAAWKQKPAPVAA